MKILNILFGFCLIGLLASCGDDPSCETNPSDWAGEFSLKDDNLDCTIGFANRYSVEAGSTEGTISINGTEYTPSADSCTVVVSGNSINLVAGELQVNDGDCTAFYDTLCNTVTWIGSYTLDESSVVCNNPDLNFASTFSILNGPTTGTINFDGDVVSIDKATCSFEEFGGVATLVGDEIRVSIDGCTATFKR